MAIFGNISVLRIFSGNASLRTPSNMLVMNLAVSDLLLMICLIPECVYNFFTGGPWRFGDFACQIHAFTGIFLNDECQSKCSPFIFFTYSNSGALCGYNQITTLMVIRRNFLVY